MLRTTDGRPDLCCNPCSSRCKFGLSKVSVLSFPFGDCGESVTEEQGVSGGVGHPGGHAHAVFSGRRSDPVMNLGVDADGELW
jgi:hypothetical protein